MEARASLAPAAEETSVVTIPVSAGELIDKITILALKTRRVRNAQKRLMAARELALLQRAAAPLRAADASGEIAALTRPPRRGQRRSVGRRGFFAPEGERRGFRHMPSSRPRERSIASTTSAPG